jgi:hypothetical protein
LVYFCHFGLLYLPRKIWQPLLWDSGLRVLHNLPLTKEYRVKICATLEIVMYVHRHGPLASVTR